MKAVFLLILLSFFLITNCKLPFFNLIRRNNGLSEENNITYIYGHINPDTDAITAPIILADFLRQKGSKKEIKPVRLGDLNKETEFILKFFNISVPELISDPQDADEVILVDHNNPSQSINFEKVNIVGLIDHHAITGFYTNEPITIITKPLGCTATILYELYISNNITIPLNISQLMISAIISDTLLLKSAVTTQEDIDTLKALADYAHIEYENFGRELLKAGTNISDLTEEEIINLDSKSYKVKGYNIQIAFLNSVNITSLLLERKVKLLEEINNFIKKNKKQLFTLIIVDIYDMDSTVLAGGEYIDTVEKAFNVTLVENEAFLKGITSRKKEVYPKLAEEFQLLPEYKEYSTDSDSDDPEQNNSSTNIITNLALLFILLFLF